MLSIVIPVYNSEHSIQLVVNELINTISYTAIEILLINDGSDDNSEKICSEIEEINKCVKFISLRKNFGEHNAVMCGLNHINGDYVVIMDDDLQNPVSEVKKLYDEIQKGFDVVYSIYDKKKHSIYRNIGSKLNGWMACKLLDKPKGLYLSSFKIIDSSLVKEIIKYKGPYPYIDGLILRSTNNIGKTITLHSKRNIGKSSYTISKLVNLYFNMFFNFSVKPLRIVTLIGFTMFGIGIIFSFAFIIEKLLYPDLSVGWTSIIVAILTFSGLQAMCLGLIGEYLGKLYLDVNNTPQYSIKEF